MNILQKALAEVRYSLPNEILQIAFIDKGINYRAAPISLEERIMSKVIRPRVIVDIDIAGGELMIVDTSGVIPQLVDVRTMVFELPAEKVMYKTILAVLSASYIPTGGNFNQTTMPYQITPQSQGSDLMSAGMRVGNAMANSQPLSNSEVELIGYNTVLIRQQMRVSNVYSLRVMVGNEENLNNLPIKAIPYFSKLCVLAVKAYIYNTLLVAMDENFIYRGQQLGVIKSIIEGYADVNEMYQVFLKENWSGVAYMSDHGRMRRFIKLSISPGL